MKRTIIILLVTLFAIFGVISTDTCDYAGTNETTEETEEIAEPIDYKSAAIDRFTTSVPIPKIEFDGNRESGQKNLTYKTIVRAALIVPESTNAETINTEPVETSPPAQPQIAAVETTPPETVAETYPPETTMVSAETSPPMENTTAPASATPVYSVNGAVLDESIQAFLYLELAKYGIEWFMPYAIMIAYQESQFNPTIINQQNGIDMGLFQFRVYYYPGQNIFDPYEQITIFCSLMANRANIGCSVNEMISRHNTSDYGSYNPQYVAEVMQHQGGLCRIR